ncbi:MAG: helix-turn-helix transcriptional regulator [Mogibacterium sp.]|uniref:helix-turn-helix domain-containing protein n=1 Tax=Mogibacterium sp. TaxID=2049035 RepID=UPI001A4856B8|nr:helix-turn-helix transcriptional regulator [Mogibacterium sp.]MBL6468892.1 helix-turn-helix transcriptional regulator [Mogibacterium sp.]
MKLGRRITELRKANNLTQEGLAERCSVTRQTISNWENGKSYPDLEMLVFISDSFDISLDALVKGDGKMVQEITKEQRKGRFQNYKMAALTVGLLLLVGLGLYALEHTYVRLSTEDCGAEVVEVNSVHLDDVKIDRDRKMAFYKLPNDNARTYYGVNGTKAPAKGIYVFEGEEYNQLMNNKVASYITLEVPDRAVVSVGSPKAGSDTVELSLEMSNFDRIFGKKGGSAVSTDMWFSEVNRIVDANAGNSIVWKKSK